MGRRRRILKIWHLVMAEAASEGVGFLVIKAFSHIISVIVLMDIIPIRISISIRSIVHCVS